MLLIHSVCHSIIAMDSIRASEPRSAILAALFHLEPKYLVEIPSDVLQQTGRNRRCQFEVPSFVSDDF